LRAKAVQLLERMRLSPLAEVAAAEGLKVETLAEIKRGSATPPLSPRAIDAIFRTPKDGFGSAETEQAAELVIFRVTDVTLPETDANSEEAKKLQAALNQSYTSDVFAEYLAHLQSQIGVTINENALKQVVTGQRSDQN
jgi:peptidyl-prolyl cis-trans isomerase D